MSYLTKQKTARRGAKKKSTASHSKVFDLLHLTFIEFPIILYRGLSKVSARNPRASFYFFSALAAALLFFVTNLVIVSIQESVLPSKIAVHTADPGLKNTIYKIANISLKNAHAKKSSRSELLRNLGTELKNVQNLDEVWLRSGLDASLQITATSQIAVFLLETQNDKLVVSNKLRIIDTNPSLEDQKKLLRVVAPDVKITWKKGLTRTRSGKFYREDSANVNLGWLFRQTTRIQNGFAAISIPYGIDRIAWRAEGGFSVILSQNLAAPVESSNDLHKLAPQTKEDLTVILGESTIQEKLDKLPEMIESLAKKKVLPSHIDLSFPDKAVIKMSENGGAVAL